MELLLDMKIVLIQPPIEDFYETNVRLQPIGLCYLKASLNDHFKNMTVVIKDYHQGYGRKTIAYPKPLSYLKTYYASYDQSPFSMFHQYYHFGADYQLIADEIEQLQPDLVGISSLFTPYYQEVLNTAQAIKQRLKIPIVVGGSHASALPESLIRSHTVDFLILGEGERPIVELVEMLMKNRTINEVSNLVYKKEGQVIYNDIQPNYPMHDIPMPDLSDFSIQRYQYENKPLCFVVTSRSCPHRCSFCSVHLTFGYQFRRLDKEQVVHEIWTRYQQGFRVFDFEDDNLTYFQEDMKWICRQLIQYFPNQEIQLLAMNGISYLSLDHELLILMKQAGFSHLNLALVSSDQTVRQTTKRPHTLNKYLEVVQQAYALGFQIVSYQIVGLPQESLESMIQTMSVHAQLPVLMGTSIFYLTPNSPISFNFPQFKSMDPVLSRSSAMAIEESIDRRSQYSLFILTRIINFIKSFTLSQIENDQFDAKDCIGIQILRRLLIENELYVFSNQSFSKNENFNMDIFYQFWDQIDSIVTIQGETLHKSYLENKIRQEASVI